MSARKLRLIGESLRHTSISILITAEPQKITLPLNTIPRTHTISAHFIFAVDGVDPLASPPISVAYSLQHAAGWTPYTAAPPGSFFFQTHLIGNRTQVWSYQYDKTFPAISNDLPKQICVRVSLGDSMLTPRCVKLILTHFTSASPIQIVANWRFGNVTIYRAGPKQRSMVHVAFDIQTARVIDRVDGFIIDVCEASGAINVTHCNRGTLPITQAHADFLAVVYSVYAHTCASRHSPPFGSRWPHTLCYQSVNLSD